MKIICTHMHTDIHTYIHTYRAIARAKKKACYNIGYTDNSAYA